MREERARRGGFVGDDDVFWDSGLDDDFRPGLSCVRRAWRASHGADARRWWMVWAMYSIVPNMVS